MKINIITPCSRPENLMTISKSINIPKENYRWIVVFDRDELPNSELIPNNCEIYLHKNSNSIVGNDQRNFSLDLIKEDYVYFNDDDTIIHPDFWENVKDSTEDFIYFIQDRKDGTIRIYSNTVQVGYIDSHNFLLKYDIIGNTRWVINKYEADGIFANECFNKSKTTKRINKVLSTYNYLNDEHQK